MVENNTQQVVAISVNASTDAEVYEKIKYSNRKNICVENVNNWKSHLESILTCLKENPIEIVYDPEDDGIADSFELERFIAFVHHKDRPCVSLKYIEYDRKFIDYQFRKKLIDEEADILLKITEYSFDNVPFFARAYVIE